MRRLLKVNGIWRLRFSGKPERRFCAICSHEMEYSDHRNSHTFSEHDKALVASYLRDNGNSE